MTISDYYDIEILASREGITPSRYMAREEERKARFTKYNHTEKGAERLKRYAKSEKGKANDRRKMQRKIASGKNAEACRRYRERRKMQAG